MSDKLFNIVMYYQVVTVTTITSFRENRCKISCFCPFLSISLWTFYSAASPEAGFVWSSGGPPTTVEGHRVWHILYTSHTKTLRHTKSTTTLKPYHKAGVVDNHGDNTFLDLLAHVAIDLNVSVLRSRRNRWFTLHFKLYLPKKENH